MVAQNASLTLATPTEGAASIGKVHAGAYKRGESDQSASSVQTIELGDLYAEEEKDLLFEIILAALPAVRQAEPVVTAVLRYFDCATNAYVTVKSELVVARPAEAPPDQPVNALLEQHRNRICAAQAIERATQLADRGELQAGRELLRAAALEVRSSPTAEEPMMRSLATDLEDLEVQYADEPRYRSLGSKMSKMSAQAHMVQRGNHRSEETYSSGAKAKKAMKMAWFSK